jgi:hypothetical protein
MAILWYYITEHIEGGEYMERKQLTTVAYEVLLDYLHTWMDSPEVQIKKESEAVRTILELFLGVEDEYKEEYLNYVKEGRAKGNTSIKRKKGRKRILKQLLPKMEKDRFYTLTQVAELAGVSRRIIRDDVIVKYQEYFVIDMRDNGTYRLKKRSKKQREEYVKKQAEENQRIKEKIEEKRRRQELGLE